MANQQQTNQPPPPPAIRPVTLNQINPPPAFAAIFQGAADDNTMNQIFGANNPFNPIMAAVPNTRQFSGNANSVYLAATAVPFALAPAGAWTNSREATVIRETFMFCIHLGDAPRYQSGQNNRSISSSLATDAIVNNVPNPGCWVYQKSGVTDTSLDWQKVAKEVVNKTGTDCRGSSKRRAVSFWSSVNPTPGDHWHQLAVTPGALLRVMYRCIHDAARPAACVRWLLGDRTEPHLDVNALYTVGNRHFVPDPTQNNLPRDLVPVLREWLEISCAFVLAESFVCVHIGRDAKDFKDAMRKNLIYFASVYPHRAFLQANVAQFPYKA